MATKRKALTQKIRFEVFKRDGFTCQYCGAKSPEVTLEVDHIIPVSEGGSNDILNLVTACFNCNRGKSNTKLSDDTIVQKRRKQAEETQKRIEQIKMLAKWEEELIKESEVQIDTLEKLFMSYYPEHSFSQHYTRTLKKWINQFGYLEVYSALKIALDQYNEKDLERGLGKVGGICYNKRKQAGGGV